MFSFINGTRILYHKIKSLFINIVWYKKNVYELKIRGVSVLFATKDRYSKQLFFSQNFNGKVHEDRALELMSDKLRTSRCFVDVGAHIGYYSCIASKIMDNGIVYAFEMDKSNYELLQNNLQLNACKNVESYNVAVSDSDGEGTYLKRQKGPTALLHLSQNERNISESTYNNTECCKTVSLDKFFEDKDFLADIVKIDIEGGEIKAVLGMQKILSNSDMELFIEVHPKRLLQYQQKADILITILKDYRYKVFEIENFRIRTKEDKLREIDKNCNIKTNMMLYACKN